MELTITVAFIAGLISFLSPCVLPIIPGFIGYLAGSRSGGEEPKRWESFLASLFFVLGFSFIFSLLGVLLNTVLEAVAYDVQIWLGRVGGVIIILFGLFLTGLIRIAFLEKEYKFNPNSKFHFNSKYLTAFLFGSAFAAGWTPCVGAVLGAVLGLATSQPGSAFTLLLSYSIGLGLPFLIVGAGTSYADRWIQKISPYLKTVNIIFGIVLIALGVLVFTNSLNLIANFGLINSLLLN
jgi:cytochrome c-type biogenesis protein